MDKKPLTIAEQFCVNRIREFPSLYPHKYSILARTLFDGAGGAYWTEDGTIANKDLHYDNATKKWVPYPYVISEEVAEDTLLHYQGKFLPGATSGIYADAVINTIPDNAEDSWLDEIYYFLCSYEKYTPEVIEKVAAMRTFLHYGAWENPHAGLPQRYINDYSVIVNKVASWKARIREIQYVRTHGKVDPETFMGMYI